MEMNYCRRCGEQLEQKAIGFWQCPNHHSTYLNASPTVGVFFVTDDKQVILSRRGIEPNKGMLDSFGGFVDVDESAETAAQREIHEELGLDTDQYEPLTILCTAPSHYFFEQEPLPVLSTFFWSTLKPGAAPHAQDDVAEIVTLPLKDLDLALLCADDIKQGMRQLQKVMEVSDV